jgi:ribosomal protein S18 acetylase RimI-like enzyme
MTASHPLDHPIGTALRTRQAPLADINGPARRFPHGVAPFAELDDFSPASFAALRALLEPDQPAVLFTPDPVPPSPDLELVMAATGEQMIGMPQEASGPAPEMTLLTGDDVAEMRALVEITRPGPFGPRTHELGDFLGIRIGGRLAAMTGERMKPANYTEMTAVCVHPDFRGRGLAQHLLARVARRIAGRGEIAFLHVFSDNAPAIALYKRQGMTIRRRLHVTVLGRMGDNLKEKLPH